MSQAYFVSADLWRVPCHQLWDNGNDGLLQDVQHSGERRHCELVFCVVHFLKAAATCQITQPESFFPCSIQMNPYDGFAIKMDGLMFVHLLKRLLDFDADRRISAPGALKHCFVTMDHLKKLSCQP